MKITITSFTDPVCSWCWASEPIFRGLETHYPDMIEFRYIQGGLVRSIEQMSPRGDVDEANDWVANHWLEGASRHKMPVKVDGFHLFSHDYPHTFNQGIAYKAAQKVDPDKADKYLRRIREATISEAKLTSHPDVLIELASEVGIDVGQFIAVFGSEEAKNAYNGDLAFTRGSGVSGFPTFIVKVDTGRQVMLRGYQSLDSFKQVISYLSDGLIEETEVKQDFETLLKLFSKTTRLAQEEARVGLGFISGKEVDDFIDGLVNEQKVTKEIVNNSYFIELKQDLMCDLETGICL